MPKSLGVYCLVIFLTLIILWVYSFYGMSMEHRTLIWAEHGLVESLAALFFGVAALLALLIRTRTYNVFSFLMLMASLRELDLHKYWTVDSILKTRFYLNESTPLVEKMIGGAVVILLLLSAIYLFKRIPIFVKNLWGLQVQSLAVFFALACLVVAKKIDSMARLFPFLADFHAQNNAFLITIEEGLELAAALLFIRACFPLSAKSKSN